MTITGSQQLGIGLLENDYKQWRGWKLICTRTRDENEPGS